MAFEKAKREKVFVKILLFSPSGGGKSYSALRLATGMAKKCNSKIAYIGTEGSRDKYYANEFDYDLCQLDDYSITSYIDAIEDAIDNGYKILIIDSISPEWQWLNDQHDKMTGNSFTNWGKLKPKHRKFMETILQSDIHIIACARGKTEWTLEEQNGKQVPKKLGMGATQDKDISFDYTVSFQLDQSTHNATVDKDNTHIFEDRIDVLTEKDGEALMEWANTGDAPIKKEKTKVKIDFDKNEKLKIIIQEKMTNLENNDIKKEVINYMKKNNIVNFKDVSEIPTEYMEYIVSLLS
jgi:hypothetical protein